MQNSEKNEHECLRDCLIRWCYGEAATAGPPPERGITIRDRDLFPVPTPVNNALYAYEDCLLWRGPLNFGGYAGNRHRQVLEEVSGEKLQPRQQVNHLCQRPFCLQPGHLYAGDGQDNADDRRAHGGSYLRFDMLEGNRVPAGAKEISPWWKERQVTWLPQTLPAGADCHHHAGPRAFVTRQLFCQVCLLFLEDEDGNGSPSPLSPSILREFSHDHQLETPAPSLTSCAWRWHEKDYRQRHWWAVPRKSVIGSLRSFWTTLNRKVTGVRFSGPSYSSVGQKAVSSIPPDQPELTAEYKFGCYSDGVAG